MVAILDRGQGGWTQFWKSATQKDHLSPIWRNSFLKDFNLIYLSK